MKPPQGPGSVQEQFRIWITIQASSQHWGMTTFVTTATLARARMLLGALVYNLPKKVRVFASPTGVKGKYFTHRLLRNGWVSIEPVIDPHGK